MENKQKADERLKELEEKYFCMNHTTQIQLNFNLMNQTRVCANIFIGIAAGIYGLRAFEGILWWMAMSMVTSALIAFRLTTLGFEANGQSKFFPSFIQAVTTNMFSNIMTYMLFWIMFYNIVYVV